MCRKMNVNLIRIIVHNCCPVVPAVGPLRRRGNKCCMAKGNVSLNLL